MRLDLLLQGIMDRMVRDNFQRVKDALLSEPILKADLRFFALDLRGEGALDHFRFPHKMGVIPQDLLVTQATGSGGVTWHWEEFDRENVVLSTTGPVYLRFFLGAHP